MHTDRTANYVFVCNCNVRKTSSGTFGQTSVLAFAETVFWPARELGLADKVQCHEISYFVQMVFTDIRLNLKMCFPRQLISALFPETRADRGTLRSLALNTLLL